MPPIDPRKIRDEAKKQDKNLVNAVTGDVVSVTPKEETEEEVPNPTAADKPRTK